MNNYISIIFAGTITFLIYLVTILITAIIASLFFEWGFSRWKKLQFSRKRWFTFLLICFAIRLLFPHMGSQNMGSSFRKSIDTTSDYRK